MAKSIMYDLTDPKYSGWCKTSTLEQAVKRLDESSDYADDDGDEDWDDNTDYEKLLSEIILPFLKEFNEIYSAKKNRNSDVGKLESNLRALVQVYWENMYEESIKFFGTLDDDYVLREMTIYVKKPKERAAVDFLLTMAEYIPEENQILLKAKMGVYEEAKDIVLGHTGLSSYGNFPRTLIKPYYKVIEGKIATMDGKIKPPRDLIPK